MTRRKQELRFQEINKLNVKMFSFLFIVFIVDRVFMIHLEDYFLAFCR